MTQSRQPVNAHKAYHAHIYFDEDTKHIAKPLCDESAKKFKLKIGRFHEKLVGPHPRWSCQVSFSNKDFEEYITWLEANRGDLTVFIHALTGDDLKDHTEYAYWLGQALDLKLEIFNNG